MLERDPLLDAALVIRLIGDRLGFVQADPSVKFHPTLPEHMRGRCVVPDPIHPSSQRIVLELHTKTGALNECSSRSWKSVNRTWI